jgi:Flp pilus assembly protein TadG
MRAGRRFRHLARRWRGEEDGATAVEFGLVAMPFFGLLFAIIETAMAFWSGQILQTAVTDASRRIYTGEFQTATATTPSAEVPGKFREEICKRLVSLIDCSAVKVDVQTYTSFPDGVPPAIVVDPVTGERKLDPNFGQYTRPGPTQIVIVRAAVEQDVYVSLLNPNHANLSNGKRLLVATAAFKTEPFTQ